MPSRCHYSSSGSILWRAAVRLSLAWCGLVGIGPTDRPCAAATQKTTLDFDAAPASQYLDRWVYPFNATPGQRIQAPTFGAMAEETFDERDGQFLLAVNTEALGIPKGISFDRYRIQSLSFRLTEAGGDYAFDGTYDDFRTYLPSGPLATSDTDPGRPIELFGVGMRNGFTQFGWPDGNVSTSAPVFSAATPMGPMGKGTRNVFASDALGNDLSNAFDSLQEGANGSNVQPFAIGQASLNGQPLAPGANVELGTEFLFQVNMQDPLIANYIQRSLSNGQLAFIVSSLHSTGELGVGDTYPNLATANHFAVAGPKFEIVWELLQSLPGDFDADALRTQADLDLLTAALRTGTVQPSMDLNSDQQINTADRVYWIEQLMNSVYGDANLDTFFNSFDLVTVFQAGQYEDSVVGNSGWGEGDWDGDGEFTSADFLLAFQTGAYERAAPTATVAVVPEPAGAGLMAIGYAGWLAALGRRRRLRR